MTIALEGYRDQLLEFRRWLHRHPELSMEERETSRYIRDQLESRGIPCRITGETGVVGDLTVKEGLPLLAVRAEIDALPVEEKTGLPFASCYPGKMHACGHDAIAAAALCLAAVLAEHRDKLRCNVRFLFEPGEETGEGARYMIAHGALENPRPAGILVFHYGNQESGAMEIQKSISTAAVGGLQIRAAGKASHWSQKEDGIDALYAASRLAVAIEEINRSLPTDHPFVLGFGRMRAGTAGNIMADEAVLDGSLRAFTEADFEKVFRQLTRRAEEIGRETGAKITVKLTKKLPPIVNDGALVKRGAGIGRELYGDRFYLGEKPFLVGDNAALYLEQVPGMRAVFLAGKPGEAAYPVHNPRFDIDEEGLMDALKFLTAFLCEG